MGTAEPPRCHPLSDAARRVAARQRPVLSLSQAKWCVWGGVLVTPVGRCGVHNQSHYLGGGGGTKSPIHSRHGLAAELAALG